MNARKLLQKKKETRMAKMFTKQMAAVLPQMVTEVTSSIIANLLPIINNNTTTTTTEPIPTEPIPTEPIPTEPIPTEPITNNNPTTTEPIIPNTTEVVTGPIIVAETSNKRTCTYKTFSNCKPEKFTGTEGATALLQWFEDMEKTFANAACPDELKVQYGTSVFSGHALTWWNNIKRTKTPEVATSMSWEELKQLMVSKFCPRSELKKLEIEFWNLKQDSGENAAYVARFHELSLLVPHMVTPLERAIEKFCDGLPKQIRDAVISSKPTTLEEAIILSAVLTDNQVKDGTLHRKGSTPEKTTVAATQTKGEPKNKKRKTNNRNYAIANKTANQMVPVQQNSTSQLPRKEYGGTSPKCNTCQRHHPAGVQCWYCNRCGRYGHLAEKCRTNPLPGIQTNVQNIPTLQNAPMVHVRACFKCGDPNHMKPACPYLVNTIRAPAQPLQQFQPMQPVQQIQPAQPVPQAQPAAPQVPLAQGRVFNLNHLNVHQAQANNDVVNGTTQ